ncbi:MAG: esterase-like activity of phytase family protein [Pirellulales bacterium]|nr:esterase-like activity of phytase family protein [Pirellulales bacterium]
MQKHFVAGIAVLACCIWSSPRVHAARWSIAYRGTFTLDNNGFNASELSGIAFRGRVGGLESTPCTSCGFVAVQDSSASVLAMNLSFHANGSIASAVVVGQTTLTANLDYEGIAVTGLFEQYGGVASAVNRVLVSDEATPGIREVRLDTGAVVATVPIPAVYAHVRNNRGFEALTTWNRSSDGFRMAVANEEALTIDGPAAGLAGGTVVRIQTYDVVGNPTFNLSYQPRQQWAYVVDPIHGGASTSSQTQSGLVEMAAMPDRTLLALERSAALTVPVLQNRLYEIDPTGATDVGGAAFEAGLVGQSYAPVGKELLWSGTIGGVFGENLEGLTLGPQLANGNWTLVGVVDNGGSGATTLVSFEATPIVSADFDVSGAVDGSDFLLWQRDYRAIPPWLADQRPGDANRDGQVDSADLAVWHSGFGAAASVMSRPVPEPGAAVLAILGTALVATTLESSVGFVMRRACETRAK